jgi:4-hydroxy-2-oxoheptanedioate aldolase
MDMPINRLKHELQAGRAQIGLWSSLASHIGVEVIAGAGFDWLLLDTEHSPNELHMVHTQLAAMERGTASAVVRPAWNDTVTIKRLLDLGAQTLLIPMVQNAEEARRAVAATRYPPQGVRGLGTVTRANDYGRVKDYLQRVHDELCTIVQIETREALANLEEIAAVDGVDGLFIGPSDLSADMGLLGQGGGHPEVQALIEESIVRIVKTGKFAGILTPLEDLARRSLQLGALFVAVGSDSGLLARHSEALAERFKGAR